MAEYVLPHPLRNRRGEVRKVGVELEFGGMSLPEAAEAVRAAFDGTLRQEHEHRYAVTTALGEFDVAFDSSLLSDKKYAALVERLGLGEGVKGAVEGVLRKIGDAILPLEVGTPPIPATELRVLDRLERALREHHAEGTRSGVFYAFALHFNPEAVDPADAAGVTRALRAFLLLYHWLFRKGDIDLLRRALPFIDPFPERYARLVIDPGYAPDWPGFTADYLEHNPTRNRPLDLLPLLAHNDPALTARPEVEGQKVHPRPTYHYRLPNSLIDVPDWSIATEWGRWVLVERLADNPELMGQLSRAYLDWDNTLLGYLEDRWFHFIDEQWVPRLRGEPAGFA
jgi:hypothetical protein